MLGPESSPDPATSDAGIVDPATSDAITDAGRTTRQVPYRGLDRRSRSGSDGTEKASLRTLLWAAAFVPAAVVPAALAIGRGASLVEAADLVRVFAAVLAVGTGVVSLVCWRMLGKAFAGWRAVALLDLGILTLLSNSLDLLGVGGRPESGPLGRLLTGLLVAIAVIGGLRSDEVDARLRPQRLIGGSLIAGICLLGLLNLVAVHGLLPLWTAGTASRTLVEVFLGACFLGLGLVAWRTDLKRRGRLSPAVLAGLGLAYGSGIVQALAGDDWSLVPAILRLAALALAGGSVAGELASLLHSQDRQTVRLRGDVEALRAAIEDEQADLDERLHDLRNAVAALRSADSTLHQHAGQLDGPTRSTLAEAITAELARLQVLIEPGRRLKHAPFRVVEAIGPVLEAERAHGTDLKVELQDVVARGDGEALARVVQNLLVNARQYASGTKVRVRVARHVGRVEIRVEDGGPGIAPSERLSIFGRGERGATSEGTKGSGLGLFVAARLMAGMGGSIHLGTPSTLGDPGAPGVRAVPTATGACFVVELPAVPTEPQALSIEAGPHFFDPEEAGGPRDNLGRARHRRRLVG